MKIFDIVITNTGKVGIISELTDKHKEASILFINKIDRENEKIAWYKNDEFKIIGSVINLLKNNNL